MMCQSSEMFPFAYGRSVCCSEWNREASLWTWLLKRVEGGKSNSDSQLLETTNCLGYQEVRTKTPVRCPENFGGKLWKQLI